MAKEVKKRPSKAAASGRVRRLTKKQQRTKAKKQVRQLKPLPGSFRLTWGVLVTIRRYWRTLGGIVTVYLLLNILFASGIGNISASFDIIKEDLKTNSSDGLWRAAAGFTSLVGSSGTSGSPTGSTLQSTLFVLASLVIIWALRHLMSGQAVSVKQAYYKSMAPLIPFLLVLVVIIIQLLPVTIGAGILTAVATSVFTDTTIATIITSIIFALLAGWSLYMISASLFALYIVTLPDMEPRQALRSARELVGFRRLAIIRKIFFMPVFILAVMAVIIVPLILYASAIVPAVFYILSMLSILFIHTYLYSLYRSLLE